MRQIKLAGELPLVQHAFRCGVRGDPNLHIEDASASAATAAAAMMCPDDGSYARAVRRTGWTVSVLRPAMIMIVPTAGVAGIPPMVVDDVCRSRGRSVY